MEFVSPQLILNQATSQQFPKASANFRFPPALAWLDAISESNAILSAILAVIHPTLYDAGWQTTERLRNTPEIGPQDILSRWASVFSGVSVISNRNSPPHRDGNSRPHWYDLLVTLGRYRNCKLKLPGIGISLDYGPGTVVGLSGSVLEHEVPIFEGYRVCYAYFMRDNVFEWAKVPAGHWMRTEYYQ
jgi:Oxygenase domain of the 2OGFeDO superfamily